MLCGPREPFDYAIYGLVFRTLGNWSLEHRTSGKVPRIEANCWVIATHHTIPAIRLELSRAALPPKADKRETSPNVRLVPLADICSAANVRQGLSHGQFRVLACRVPFFTNSTESIAAPSWVRVLDRFFHRRRQVSPVVKYLTHRFFDGDYHLLDGDVAVSFHDNLASHFRTAVHGGGWHRAWPADKYTRREDFQRLSRKLSSRMGSSVPSR